MARSQPFSEVDFWGRTQPRASLDWCRRSSATTWTSQTCTLSTSSTLASKITPSSGQTTATPLSIARWRTRLQTIILQIRGLSRTQISCRSQRCFKNHVSSWPQTFQKMPTQKTLQLSCNQRVAKSKNNLRKYKQEVLSSFRSRKLLGKKL